MTNAAYLNRSHGNNNRLLLSALCVVVVLVIGIFLSKPHTSAPPGMSNNWYGGGRKTAGQPVAPLPKVKGKEQFFRPQAPQGKAKKADSPKTDDQQQQQQ